MRHTAWGRLPRPGLTAPGALSHLPVVAPDGQELTAGAPGHRLDAQGPLVSTVCGQQPAIQGVEQDLILQARRAAAGECGLADSCGGGSLRAPPSVSRGQGAIGGDGAEAPRRRQASPGRGASRTSRQVSHAASTQPLGAHSMPARSCVSVSKCCRGKRESRLGRKLCPAQTHGYGVVDVFNSSRHNFLFQKMDRKGHGALPGRYAPQCRGARAGRGRRLPVLGLLPAHRCPGLLSPGHSR